MDRMYMNRLSEWLSVKIIARYTVDWQVNMTLILRKLQKMYKILWTSHYNRLRQF